MDQIVHLDLSLLLKVALVHLGIVIVIVWLVVRSLFSLHFKSYKKWVEDEVYADWRGHMRALREHYDDIIGGLEAHYNDELEEHADERRMIAKSVQLLGDRMAVQEKIFDKIMSGVALSHAVASVMNRCRSKTVDLLEKSKRLGEEWKNGKE